MKKCENCGTTFRDSAKFCPVCGTEAPLYPTFGGKAAGFGIGLLYVFYYFLVQSVASFVYTLIATVELVMKDPALLDIPTFLAEAITEQTYAKISEITIVSAVITLVTLLLFFIIRKKKFWRETKFNRAPGFIGIAVAALGVSLNYMVSLLQAFTPMPEFLIKWYEKMYSFIGEGNVILEFIAVAVCAPVIEELIFRALCYGPMRKVMPPAAAMIISAVIFGIAHGNPISFVYTAFLGTLLAYLYEKSGSLWTPILLHFGFNAGSYLVQMSFKNEDLLFYAVILFASTIVSVILGATTIKVYRNKEKRTAEKDGESIII